MHSLLHHAVQPRLAHTYHVQHQLPLLLPHSVHLQVCNHLRQPFNLQLRLLHML
jgi:hypothetical protein